MICTGPMKMPTKKGTGHSHHTPNTPEGEMSLNGGGDRQGSGGQPRNLFKRFSGKSGQGLKNYQAGKDWTN